VKHIEDQRKFEKIVVVTILSANAAGIGSRRSIILKNPP
jgi:hypothetical protein